MKAIKVKQSSDKLLDPTASWWNNIEGEILTLFPTPLAMVNELSKFLAISEDHGVISKLEVQAVHNGKALAIKLRWKSARNDQIFDLDQFQDGAAVMFPTTPNSSAITMGARDKPVNAWYWRAGKPKPYEVMAEGFRFVERLENNGGSDLVSASEYADDHWNLVFSRSLDARNGLVRFAQGKTSAIAFSAWSGENSERSGRKSFSGEFQPLILE